jgi:hypothetical protein
MHVALFRLKVQTPRVTELLARREAVLLYLPMFPIPLGFARGWACAGLDRVRCGRAGTVLRVFSSKTPGSGRSRDTQQYR